LVGVLVWAGVLVPAGVLVLALVLAVFVDSPQPLATSASATNRHMIEGDLDIPLTYTKTSLGMVVSQSGGQHA